MDNLQKIYLSKFSFAEHSGGCRNVLPGEEWSDSECVSEYDAFYYIKEGGCTFVIDGEKYEGIPGRLFFIPAGVSVFCSNDKHKKSVVYWIRMKVYPNDINMLKFLGLPYFVDVDSPLIIQKSFALFFEANESELVVDRLHVKSFVFQLLSIYIILAKRDTVSVDRGKDEIIYRIVDFIDKNIEMNPSNNDLARICHFHPQSFIRYFKKKTGHTPARYIKLKKMERAKMLIEETDMSFSKIMERVGYTDASHFSKSFKSVYGVIPRMYRQSVRKKGEE